MRPLDTPLYTRPTYKRYHEYRSKCKLTPLGLRLQHRLNQRYGSPRVVVHLEHLAIHEPMHVGRPEDLGKHVP